MKNLLKHTVLFLSTGAVLCFGKALTRPELTADNPIVFDQEQNKLTATGNAHLEHRDFTIDADTINYYTQSSVGEAEGDVELVRRDLRVIGDDVQYNIIDKSISANNVRYGRSPVFIRSGNIEGSLNDLDLCDTTVFFGEPDCYALNVHAGHVKICSSDNICRPDYISVENAVFKIGKVPVFYLPKYSQELYEYPISYHGGYGYRSQLGPYVRNTLLWTQFPGIKFGALFDYYTKRGVLVGPAAKYCYSSDITDVKGDFKSGFINDTGNRGTNIYGKPVEQHRQFVEWRHQQSLAGNLKLTSQFRYWGDSEVERDFRPDLFKNNPEPDNFFEAMYTGKNYYLSLFTRYAPNDFNPVQQRVPEVNFHLIPTPVFNTPIYQQLQLSAAHLQEKDPSGEYAASYSNRFDSYYGWTYPYSYSDIFTIIPVMGGRITHYTTTSQADDKTFYRGQIGFDAQFNSYGMWDYCNDFWDIHGVRHILRPTVQYRYSPFTHSGLGSVPKIEPNLFTTNLKPLDLAQRRDRDQPTEINTLRLGLENFFQTRSDCDYMARNLAYLHFHEDIRFSREPGQDTFSDLFTELGFMPYHWIDFSLFNRFDVEHLTLQELRTKLALYDGRVWTLYFTSDNLINTTDQYTLGIDWNINTRNNFFAFWRFDARKHQITEQGYGLNTRVGNSWLVQYYISYNKGTARENSFRFNINVQLVCF